MKGPTTETGEERSLTTDKHGWARIRIAGIAKNQNNTFETRRNRGSGGNILCRRFARDIQSKLRLMQELWPL
jgi:hypothetical protein